MSITAREIALELMTIIKKEKIFEKKEVSTFEKVEKLLYNLKIFKAIVNRKISILANDDLTIVSKKEVGEKVKQSRKYIDDLEKKENAREKVLKEIKELRDIISVVENALKIIENDKYYKIIELKYFEEKSLEEIAEEMEIGISTVKRKRKYLIKQLEVVIFSNEIIKEILG